MSYLDDPRVLFAAERTYLAWLRTSLGLVGLSFLVERFGLEVELSHGMPEFLPKLLALILIFMSLVVNYGALGQFRSIVKTLGEQEVPKGYSFAYIYMLNGCTMLVAMVMSLVIAY